MGFIGLPSEQSAFTLHRIGSRPSAQSRALGEKTEACLCVPGSLRPGFIESRVVCVWNFYATFVATFCNFVATFFLQYFMQVLATFFCNKKLQRSCKKLHFFLQKSCQCTFPPKKVGEKTVAKKLHKRCNKVAKSCKNCCIKLANT